jgi:hypothetical protein
MTGLQLKTEIICKTERRWLRLQNVKKSKTGPPPVSHFRKRNFLQILCTYCHGPVQHLSRTVLVARNFRQHPLSAGSSTLPPLPFFSPISWVHVKSHFTVHITHYISRAICYEILDCMSQGCAVPFSHASISFHRLSLSCCSASSASFA